MDYPSMKLRVFDEKSASIGSGPRGGGRPIEGANVVGISPIAKANDGGLLVWGDNGEFLVVSRLYS